MSMQGLDLEAGGEPEPIQQEPIAAPAAQEDDDDGLIETVKVGEQKMVPVGELINYRKQAREAKRANELIQQQMQTLQTQLQEVRPYVDKLREPGVLDRLTKGTHATPASTEQPADDQEAKDTAEDMGFYTTDGQLDVARARRVLDRIESRNARRTQNDLAPLRQQTAVQAAQVMRQRVDTMRTKEGAPLASRESLDEVFGMVPPELQADPKTAFVMALAAAGMDLFTGRKGVVTAPPAGREYSEPIYTEAPGGRRAGAGISAELAALGKRVGLSDKELAGAANRQTGRGGSVTFE